MFRGTEAARQRHLDVGYLSRTTVAQLMYRLDNMTKPNAVRL